MPRSRNIKPGFFGNEYLADLPPETRLLFIGLWCLADREGRLEDRPRGIKGRLFPFDDFNVDEMLQQLSDSPDHFILRYQVEGKHYIQVKNFLKHQNPNVREAASQIPAPNAHETCTVLSSVDHHERTADSPILNTDSPTLKHTSADKPPSDTRFDEFYKAYPVHKGKRDAQRAFAKAIKTTSLETMLAAIDRQKRSPDWLRENGRFIPHPATWLNRGQWDDEVERPPGAAKEDNYADVI